MKKVIDSVRDHHLEGFTHADWDAAVKGFLGPYFRRKRAIAENRDSLHIEFRNYCRFAALPEYVSLFKWYLSLQRRAIKIDPAGAFKMLAGHFPRTGDSDRAWLNLFAISRGLESGASPHDRKFAMFMTLEGLAEGCYKPQLEILYAFAQYAKTGSWPSDTMSLDFGALVARMPAFKRPETGLLTRDPFLSVSVNQWRNAGAHRSFRLVGPQTIEIAVGKLHKKTLRFGLRRLTQVVAWLMRVHSAVRLANVITYLEYIKELRAVGLPASTFPFGATIMRLVHGLGNAGFAVTEWRVFKRTGTLRVRNLDHSRSERDALVHASQVLDQISVAILHDPATAGVINKAAVELLGLDGQVWGSATVNVDVADAFTRGKISMNELVEQTEWRVRAAG
jgi:hypothetical protein